MITVALRILEALEQEQRSSLAHDEAVCTVGIGPRARCGQRTNLAELDERRGAHVAIDTTGDNGIVVVLLESLDGRADCGHSGCTGRIHDVVGAVEVEQVGNASRHDVGELAWH